MLSPNILVVRVRVYPGISNIRFCKVFIFIFFIYRKTLWDISLAALQVPTNEQKKNVNSNSTNCYTLSHTSININIHIYRYQTLFLRLGNKNSHYVANNVLSSCVQVRELPSLTKLPQR